MKGDKVGQTAPAFHKSMAGPDPLANSGHKAQEEMASSNPCFISILEKALRN